MLIATFLVELNMRHVPLFFRRMPVTLVGAFGVFLMAPYSLKGFGPGTNELYILMEGSYMSSLFA